MKTIIAFFRKYYGALIGGIVGGVLVGSYYYLTEYLHLTSDNDSLLRIVEFLVPSIEIAADVILDSLGGFIFLAWFLLPIYAYASLCLHIVLTIVMYGFIGLLAHYVLRNPIIIKVTIDKKNKT